MLRPCSAPRFKQKRKREASTVTEEKAEEEASVLELPIVPVEPNVKGNKAIFFIENAAVKKGFVRKRWKILYSKEDSEFLLRQKKNLNDYRPDIAYKALRAILDSPINKVGMVEAIYVKIDNGVLFEVKPHVRLPRTLKRFCGIMLELLEKSFIRTKDTRETLLRVIEEPITRHLPPKSRVIGLSYNSEKVVDMEDYVSATSDDSNLVFVVGAMVHGKINKQFTDDFISISHYSLSAKWCINLICEALQEKWKIF